MAMEKLCSYAGCYNLAIKDNRCAKHYNENTPEKKKAFANAKRNNNYNTSKWRALRNKHIKENPICFYCGAIEGLHADHIIPPEGNEELFYNKQNLQTVCARCHREKTAQEIQRRKRLKGNP